MLKINPYLKPQETLPESKQFPHLYAGDVKKDYAFFWDTSLKCYVVETTITNRELLQKMIDRDVIDAKKKIELLLADYTERLNQLKELSEKP